MEKSAHIPEQESAQDLHQKTGFIAIVGRPNVGKSTLLNQILGQKLSITSRKPQTTRHQIQGIKTVDNIQCVYVDTPGIHLKAERAINRAMNRHAISTLDGVDVIVWVVECRTFNSDDAWVLSLIEETTKSHEEKSLPIAPVILVINKIDKIKDKKELLPLMEEWGARYNFASIIPLSAQNGLQVESLEKEVSGYLPEGEFQFDADALTDRSSKFLAAEIIREKLMRQLGAELPFGLAVEIEHFKETEDGRNDVAAVIYVDKQSHKAMVIGEGGSKLKIVGRDARLAMNELFGRRTHVRLWVKVKSGWADDERALKSLGYSED
jgi:GTP-binding protein Era